MSEKRCCRGSRCTKEGREGTIRLLRLRRLVQVAVLLLLAALPWLNRDGFTGMKGSLFAFDFFGLPFADPLDAVQIGLSGIIPGWRLIAGALVVLAVALCLGRIFCSWFCPFGFLSELVHADTSTDAVAETSEN